MASRLPSLRSVAQLTLGALLPAFQGASAGAPATCTNTQLSCHNTSAVANTCCFNAPGGQLLQTQFWDTNPSTGPSDSWTIHGLWPDNCDGTYEANCDASRAYTNISAIISSYGDSSLLDFMNTYWKDMNGDDESFWEHEWGKHGTCISTFEPDCYTGYTAQEEVVDFFNATVTLFQTLDTYSILGAANIVPSSSQTYTLDEIQQAISAATGFDATIGCENGRLNQVWYHFNVRGSVQTGTFVHTSPDGSKSTCPGSDIQYVPKSGSSG